MRYYQEITLKNGQSCVLRHATGEDAEAVLQQMVQTSRETDYMARYADEITMTAEQERQYLQQLEEDSRALLIAAFVDGQLVATAGFNPTASYERYRHRATFGISVKKACWSLGIGSAMIAAVITMASQAGYEQLELGVVAGNQRALALYERNEFQVFGTREQSFRYRDRSYADEYLMVRKI